MKARRILPVIIALLMVLSPLPVSAKPTLLKTDVRVAERTEQLVLSFSQAIDYKYFSLDNPHRLVIDLPTIGGWEAVSMPNEYRGSLVSNVRFGRFDTKTSRIVLDLSAPVRVERAKLLEGVDGEPYKLIITFVERPVIDRAAPSPEVKKTSPEPKNKKIAAAKPVAKEKEVARVKSKSGAALAQSMEDERQARRGKAKAIVPEEEKPIIVIDPGHGGVDPGAIASSGYYEKAITLEYGLALRKALLRTGRYRVAMTRDDDRFILLRDRVKKARQIRGSLFVSLHADTAPGDNVSGLSVYTLSEKASDKESDILATSENKADMLSGMDLKVEEDVADILLDLAQRDTKNKSSQFADLLVRALDGKVPLLGNTHRFARFVVLKAPDIPSVLVELGFLSDDDQEKQLRAKSYRDRVVGSMVKAIDTYFSRNNGDLGQTH